MRCKQAQARINAARLGVDDEAFDSAVCEHIAGCPRCSELERSRELITNDLEIMIADMEQDSLGFDEFRQGVLGGAESPVKAIRRSSAGLWNVSDRLRPFAISVASVALTVLVIVLASSDRDRGGSYQITVAGVDQSLLTSGTLERLFAAVGLPDINIENMGCDPLCAIRITGLRDIEDTRLAVAAIEAVPDAEIQSVDGFVDKNTGMKVSKTTSTMEMTNSKNRWTLELDIDSGYYQRVSFALDSLKRDTTFSVMLRPRREEGNPPIPEEKYTVHPDGSYSTTIHALPRARLGWTEDTWTFDSTGLPIGHFMVDTMGVRHNIDIRNWAVAEKQLEKVGVYYMITYDDDGTPYHTGTNVNPETLPGYGPHLAPGMSLDENKPNPFDTVTNITFTLPKRAPVLLKIYNGANSQLVRTLIDSTLSAGEHTVTWNARSDDGKRVYSWWFLCKLQVGEYYHTITMYQVW